MTCPKFNARRIKDCLKGIPTFGGGGSMSHNLKEIYRARGDTRSLDYVILPVDVFGSLSMKFQFADSERRCIRESETSKHMGFPGVLLFGVSQ